MRRVLLFTCAIPVAILACTSHGEQAEPPTKEAEADLLPNGTIYEIGHDGRGYKVIADVFKSQGLDMKVNLEGFAPSWPLAGGKTAVLNRVGTPIFISSYGYHHTALDVMRESPEDSADVVAPVDGERSVILNGAALIRDYHDSVKPSVKGVYVANENAQVTRELLSGRLDLVAETFDRDDDSKRNLEVTAIAYSVRDQDGNVLASNRAASSFTRSSRSSTRRPIERRTSSTSAAHPRSSRADDPPATSTTRSERSASRSRS